MSEYRLPTAAADPIAIAADAGTAPAAAAGAWFAERAADQIGYIDADRRVSEYRLPAGGGAPTAIVADISGGSAAGAWFLEPSANTIGHIDPYGDIDQYRIPTADASVQGLASGTGPDGSRGAWFSEASAGQLGFISSGGQFSEFTMPGANPEAIAFAPSIDLPPTAGYSRYEAVWWTDSAASKVGFAAFPLNASSGVPLVPPPPAPSYVKLSSARRITAHRGRIRLTLRCQGDTGQCRGRVSLADASSRVAAVTAPLAQTSFSIIPSHSRSLVLKLDRQGLRLLHTHLRGLSVTVNITSSPGHFIAATRTATLRLG